MDEKQQLRQRIAKLEQENQRLRELLSQHGIADISPIQSEVLTGQHAMLLYSLFRGRKDVYSRRSINKDGHAVYYPVCENFWKAGLCPKREGKKFKCAECSNRAWAPLSQRVLLSHLQGQKEDGTDVVGIYPMLPDETCNFLVFDFDNHDGEALDWKNEVDTMRRICSQLEVPCLVERSRSGNGAHIWLLFSEPIPAETARKFGAALLTKGAEFVNIKTFQSYDRMLPAQDHMPQGGLGNLIALPLQGQALQKGNSAFINEQWEAYPDQWEYLRNAKKISRDFVEERIREWTPQGVLGVLSTAETEKATPWKKEKFSFHKGDVSGELRVVLADQIYVDTANLKPRFQNMLRRMASFQNPAFFRNIAMGYSIKGISRILCCYQDIDGYIALPRGKGEELQSCLDAADVPFSVQDERQLGQSIHVNFQGTLYPEQQMAADAMLAQDTGMLSAATAFGKTAVGAYMIAQRKVNTLILVHNREIMKNWVEDVQKFLDIQEECPEYTLDRSRETICSNVSIPDAYEEASEYLTDTYGVDLSSKIEVEHYVSREEIDEELGAVAGTETILERTYTFYDTYNGIKIADSFIGASVDCEGINNVNDKRKTVTFVGESMVEATANGARAINMISESEAIQIAQNADHCCEEFEFYGISLAYAPVEDGVHVLC